jgi:predicted nucleic acid-binding protein
VLERVYIETSVVSYLTSRPDRDVVIAGHQQTTRDWWYTRRTDFELCISQLVLTEAAAGNPRAARRRLAVLSTIELLETTVAAKDLTLELLKAGALPSNAANDALHVAVAATQEIPYLLTWNCRHLANARMRPFIEVVCSSNGWTAPVICTPDELLSRGQQP